MSEQTIVSRIRDSANLSLLEIKKIYQYYRYFRPYAKKNKQFHRFNDHDNIYIFSSPRSGSTWMGDIFCRMPASFLVWEPMYLNPPYPELKEVNFCWNPYIPENESWHEAETYFKKLYNREICSFRALRLYFINELDKVNQARYFVYKDVNSNLLIPWITKNFNINPVYIIRHPCAVVSSQMKYGHMDYLMRNPKLPYYEDHCRYKELHNHYRHVYDRLSTPEERLAADWAIQNAPVVRHPENDRKWITVSYEKLYAQPNEELNRIFSRLQIDVPEQSLREITTPSSTTIHSSVQNIQNGIQLGNWKKELTPKQIANILAIVREFNIDFYDETHEPDYSKIFFNESRYAAVMNNE